MKPTASFEESEFEELKKLDGSLVKLQNYILLQLIAKEKTIKYFKDANSKRSACKLGNDRNIDLFHALGMILYNKRIIGNDPFGSPKKLSKKEYLSKPYPRKYFDVEKTLDSLNMSYQTINGFLYENYIDHFTDIREVSKMADCFSNADYHTTYQWRNQIMPNDLQLLRREECLQNAKGCMSYNLSQYEKSKDG
jgi:hypothetical protein